MKNTRREFSFLGLGTALAGGAKLGFAKARQDNPSIVRIHQDSKLSCLEINLAAGRPGDVVSTFCRAASGTEAGEILFARSADGGASWERPVVLFSDNQKTQGHQLAGITRLNNGSLLAASTRFRFLFEGKVRWRRGSDTDGVYLRESTDGGSRWSEIRKIDTSPFRLAWTRGSIVEMPDGSLLLPLAGLQAATHDTSEPIRSFVLRSIDAGQNWANHGTIAYDAGGSTDFDEPAMISLGGQRLLCALRSHDSPRKDPPGGYLHMTISEDGGATWGETQKTSMWGHPANLLRLRDGRVLCTFGYRMHPNPGVRACLSPDGVQWKPENIFAVKELANVESADLQIGCPSSVELTDGRILTAYQVWSASRNAKEAVQPRQLLEGSLYRV
jgi:hypothetical protein